MYAASLFQHTRSKQKHRRCNHGNRIGTVHIKRESVLIDYVRVCMVKLPAAEVRMVLTMPA